MNVHQEAHAGHDGYDLFRCAIVERDADKWAEIAARYRPLMIAWASNATVGGCADERSDEIADRALSRAWAALSPDRFAAFPGLGALLAYLRACVTATAIDAARSRAANDRLAHRLEVGFVATPEQVVLEKIGRAELWQLVSSLVETEQERVILFESFALDLPPRTILTRHPQLFASIWEIYGVKRNLLARLQRNPAIQRLRQELFAV